VFLSHVVDAHRAEAYAFSEGLTLVQRIGCNNFIIQTDCAQVVETMKQGVSQLQPQLLYVTTVLSF
jgi:ribonuclease HI